MKKNKQGSAFALVVVLLVCLGCGDSVPENTVKPGQNPHVSGSPEDRIKSIESNTSLSQEKKDLYIKTIKERNGLK